MEDRNWKGAVKYLKVAVAGTIMASVGSAYTFDTVHADELATDAKVEQLFSDYAVLSDAAFKDVQADFWAADSIKWAASAGIVDGYADGTFRPNDVLTEGQFSTMLSRFYKDLGDQKSVDSAYLELAKYRVPLMGYADNYYKNNPVTRGLIAQAIAHVQGQDASLDNAIYYMFESGITVGKVVDGTMVYEEFGRTEHVTRAEAVVMFHRLNTMGKTSVADSVKSAKVSDAKMGATEALRVVDSRVVEAKPVSEDVEPENSSSVVVSKPAPKPTTSKPTAPKTTTAKPVVKKPVLKKVAAVKTPTKKVSNAKKTKSTLVVKTFGARKFVTTAAVSLMPEASPNGKARVKIPRGKVVVSKLSKNNWYKVTYAGKTGYVYGKYLKAQSVVKTTKFAKKKYVTRDALSLRTSYSASSKRLLTIPKSKIVTSGESYKGWYKVTYGGKTGWVSGKYLKAYSAKPSSGSTKAPGKSVSGYASIAKSVYDDYGVDLYVKNSGTFYSLESSVDHSFGEKLLYITYSGKKSADDRSLRIGVDVIAKMTGVSASGLLNAINKTDLDDVVKYGNVKIVNGGDEILLSF